jgi:hypothetical protein
MLDELCEIGERREFIFEHLWKLGGLGSADAIIEVVLPGSAVVSCHVTLRSRAARNEREWDAVLRHARRSLGFRAAR